MTHCQSFNIRRMALLLRWDVADEWAWHLKAFGLMAALSFIWQMLMAYEYAQPVAGYQVQRVYYVLCVVFPVMLQWLAVFIGCTFITSHTPTKAKRIAYLMLPATTTEKLVARALHITVGMYLMATAAYVAADALRLAVTSPLGLATMPSAIPPLCQLGHDFATNGIEGVRQFVVTINQHGTATFHKGYFMGMRVNVTHTLPNWIDTLSLFSSMAVSMTLAMYCGLRFKRVPWLAAMAAVGALSMAEGLAGMDDVAQMLADTALAIVLATLVTRSFRRLDVA